MFSAASKTGSQPSAAANYIEDVFSTYLYTGNATARSIINSIDLSGYGGLVWTKARNYAGLDNYLVDTVRGRTNFLVSNSTNAQIGSSDITAFRSDGYSLNADVNGGFNNSGTNFCSWTFRKQPKFFDVVTYTGNGSNRTIAHNLGSVPGMIIIKDTSSGSDWTVYHRSLGNDNFIVLNKTRGSDPGTTYWNSTTPTSTVFSVGTNSNVNANGSNFVAYLFAHNAGGFGTTGTDNVVSCNSFTTDGSGNAIISLGYEPQYVMFKASSSFDNWWIVDNMRGMPVSGNEPYLAANLSNAENPYGNAVGTTATGFNFSKDASTTYIYMAIRRPMKVPTDATTVFKPVVANPSSPNTVTTGFVNDLTIVTQNNKADIGNNYVFDRLRGTTLISSARLVTNQTGAEATSGSTGLGFDSNTTIQDGYMNPQWGVTSPTTYWNFSRRPRFFDEVCYTGNGTAGRALNHNLTVAPELMIVKSRSISGEYWPTYVPGPRITFLNDTQSGSTSISNYFGDNSVTVPPTASVFTVGSNDSVNQSGATYVAYLFATCAGVSKVGSYTGNGSTQAISCGFTGGARFVLIKRTDSTGDWYVYDTANGMTTLVDPYLQWNTNSAQATTLGSVTSTAGGFTVNATILAAINASGGSYIFLAIA